MLVIHQNLWQIFLQYSSGYLLIHTSNLSFSQCNWNQLLPRIHLWSASLEKFLHYYCQALLYEKIKEVWKIFLIIVLKSQCKHLSLVTKSFFQVLKLLFYFLIIYHLLWLLLESMQNWLKQIDQSGIACSWYLYCTWCRVS